MELANGIDGSVVMKIVSPDILHKSDAGGVKLNLETPEEVRQAYEKIIANAKKFKPDAEIKGILVSPMAAVGQEIIIGTKIDDQFGPIIMFGVGGVMVEVLKDVAFRVLPISARSARRMIDDGFRGWPPVDKKAIQHLLLAVSEIIGSYPDIQEMDLNPVIVYEQGLNVVDARVILTPENETLW